MGEDNQRSDKACYFLWGFGYADYKKKNNHSLATGLSPNPYKVHGLVIGFGVGIYFFISTHLLFLLRLEQGLVGL